jgi:hypothetical protein
MNKPLITTVDVGDYQFRIIDKTLESPKHGIYGRNFKIGGNFLECISVSIKYDDEQNPISAFMNELIYDYNWEIQLDQNGYILLLKTLLNHVHTQLPMITKVKLEDRSMIDFAEGREIPLKYFSIAFNGVTWYEKYFHARLADHDKHSLYREKVQELLYSPELKTSISFVKFLYLAQPQIGLDIVVLEKYYDKSTTFGDFFQSMNEPDRCDMVRSWIKKFMSHYLKEVFCDKIYDNEKWIITLPVTVDQEGEYYCPSEPIIHYTPRYGVGVDPCDV